MKNHDTPYTATIVVAASNSRNKSGANFVCGEADAQVKMQEAIDAIPYGKIVLLEGDYYVTADLFNNIKLKSNLILEGQGWGTRIVGTSGIAEILRIGDEADTPIIKENIVIRDLQITQDGADTGGIGIGINVDTSGNSILRNITIENAWVHDVGREPIDIEITENATEVSNITVKDCVLQGGRVGLEAIIQADNDVVILRDLTFLNLKIENMSSCGISINGLWENTTIDKFILRNILGDGGLWVANANKPAPLQELTVKNGTFDNIPGCNLNLMGVSKAKLDTLTFKNTNERAIRIARGSLDNVGGFTLQDITAKTGHPTAVVWIEENCYEVLVSGSNIEAITECPLRFDSPSTFTVVGNVLKQATPASNFIKASGASRGTVDNNLVRYSTHDVGNDVIIGTNVEL